VGFTLQQLSDLEEIKILKHRYFRAIDTADWGLLDAMFTEDVFVEYLGGNYRVELHGAANMREFLANSFVAETMAMHHGHMPEISFTGPDEAEGIWYLEDIFIHFGRKDHTYGTAIYHDVYRREEGVWKMARTVYDRVMEVVMPLQEGANYTVHRLAETGRKPHEVKDISHLITWDNLA
jgi:hypothetical protein